MREIILREIEDKEKDKHVDLQKSLYRIIF